MSPLKSQSPIKHPQTHSPSFPLCPVRGTISQKKKWKFVILLCPSCVVPKRPHMAATPGFKSQRQSSSVTPFPTPPTVGHSCQHSCIFPAFLGCHSKSGQVWPCGVEPVISKFLCRLCNQGELFSSYIMGWSHSHPPGSKHGHSYLTYLWNQLKVIDMLNDHSRG